MAGTAGAGSSGATTVEQFLGLARSTGLLPDADLAAIEAQWPAARRNEDANALARELTQQGKLTKYQAAGLYQGKPKGLVVGPFLILDRLGAGGVGTVFKARRRESEQIVALKVLSPTATRSPDAVKRFQREAEMAMRLNHPHIVRSLETGEADGQHYMVMEYVEGTDLSSHVKKQGPLPLDQAVACTVQAARALAYAHTQGVVHRDIKPGNLMLARDGQIKILDMGLARLNDPAASATGQAAEGLTQTGQVMGTVDYMAPEQALHTRLADARADVYSLGCTFYRLVTGQIPYDAESLVLKILAHREQPIPSLRTINPQISAATDLVLERMLAKKPEDRYQTMTELADDLERSLAAVPGPISLQPVLLPPPTESNSNSSGSLSWNQPVATVSVATSTVSSPAIPATKRKAMPVWAVAAVVVIAVAAGIVVAISGKSNAPIIAQRESEQTGTVSPNSESTKPNELPAEPVAAQSPSQKTSTLPPSRSTTASGNAPLVTVTEPSRSPNPSAPPTIPVRPSQPNRTETSDVSIRRPANSDDRELVRWCIDRGLTLVVRDAAQVRNVQITSMASIPPGNVTLLGVRVTQDNQLHDDDLFKLAEGPNISAVHLRGTMITDAALSHLAELPNLRTVVLADTAVTDKGLVELKKIKRLTQLDLPGSQITDAAFDTLTQLTSLSYLNLSRLPITDEKLSTLEPLVNLVQLDLQNTRVTDGAVPRLVRILNLKKLMIRQTAITDAGRVLFANLLPSCELDPTTRVTFLVATPNTANVGNVASSSTISPTTTPPVVLAPASTASTASTPPASSEAKATTSPPPEPAPVATAAKRQTIPDAKAVDEALKLVRSDLFRDAYAKAKKPDERVALARTLLDYAATVRDDPTGRYAILREARDLAAEGGETSIVIAAASLTQADYEGVDRLAWLAEAYEAAQKRAQPSAVCKSVAGSVLIKVEEAIAEESFDLAERLLNVAVVAARKAQDPATLKTALDRAKQFEKEKQQMQAVAKARETLANNPDDPGANLVIGKQLCFGEGDWTAGLQALAKCNDPTFKELAQKCLTLPAEDDEFVALGDLWWAKADKATGQAKKELQFGALHWYEQAAGKVSGLAKTKVDKRIADAKVAVAGAALGKASRSEYLRLPLSPTVSLILRLIPSGSFLMGAVDSEPERQPEEIQHRVTITRSFYLGVTEVTQEQWTAILGTSDAQFNFRNVEGPQYPTHYVFRDGTLRFVQAMNALSYASSLRFRLPTEAEWEYAARAGTTTTYYWGNDSTTMGDYAVTGAEGLRPVGTKKPNRWGLYDMAGNVAEHCSDLYTTTAYTKMPAIDPTGPLTPVNPGTTSKLYVLRGGSHQDRDVGQFRSAARRGQTTNSASSRNGFRLACDVIGPLPKELFTGAPVMPGAASTPPPPPAAATPNSPASPRPSAQPIRPVSAATPLKVGDKLEAYWGSRWYTVTVLELVGADRVKIHWDGWSSQWDEVMLRSKLQLRGNSN